MMVEMMKRLDVPTIVEDTMGHSKIIERMKRLKLGIQEEESIEDESLLKLCNSIMFLCLMFLIFINIYNSIF